MPNSKAEDDKWTRLSSYGARSKDNLEAGDSGLSVKQMRQAIMMHEKVPMITHRGKSLAPPMVLPTGKSTFGAMPRFGEPLYMGKELRREQARMNCGKLGQGMYTIDKTREGKPLNLGQSAKPGETGFGTSARWKQRHPQLEDQGPAYYDAKTDRHGMPLKLRPDNTPAFARSVRGITLYEGKEHIMARGYRGLFPPGKDLLSYDPQVTRNGMPLKLRPQSTPSFGTGPRFEKPPRSEASIKYGPTVLDPSKACAFGKQQLSRRRSEGAVGFGSCSRGQANKIHLHKSFMIGEVRPSWVKPV